MKATETKQASGVHPAAPILTVLGGIAGRWLLRRQSQQHRTSPIVGNPIADMASLDGAQAFPDTCAIKAQEVILQQFFTRDFDEGALRQVAYERGWYTPGGGTPCDHVGRLLEEAGIPITQKYDASAIDLFKALSEGKKVIVGLDGGELRNNSSLIERLEEALLGPQADHAVLVSGLDCRDHSNLGVFITDPATGTTARFPMATFLDSWSDSSCFMVQTSVPAPEWCQGMVGFDYNLGHLATVDGTPYSAFTDDFASLFSHGDYSSAFDLAELLSVIPRSYAADLFAAVPHSGLHLPTNWQSLCLSDEDWLSNALADADVLIPHDLKNSSFDDIASWLSELFT